jgi:hypothetical protein
MTDTHPSNMSKAEARKWANNLCDKWNWNAGLPAIIDELRSMEVQTDSMAFEVLLEEFNKFFNSPKADITDLIKEFLEHDE